MSREPLYHEVSSPRFGIPAWWFGAPAVAFVYVLLTPRLLPDLLPVPANLVAPVRWLIGLMLGVALLSIGQLVLWLLRTQRRR